MSGLTIDILLAAAVDFLESLGGLTIIGAFVVVALAGLAVSWLLGSRD